METKNLSTIAQWYIENGKYQILWDHVKLKHPLITENIIVAINNMVPNRRIQDNM